jgi:hypothetical protein
MSDLKEKEKEEERNIKARHELADKITEFKHEMTEDQLLNLCEIADETLVKLYEKNLTIAELVVLADYIQSLVVVYNCMSE